MKRKTILILVALIAAVAMMLVGCGSKEAPETTTAAPETAPAADLPLGLSYWSLSPSTWSSPNGATVHLTAAPYFHEEGQTAVFSVRLEGDDIETIPCNWDGKQYTASVDLNAADGYCYYVVLATADGKQAEIAVNTPAEPTDDALINMESALNSYCTLVVEESKTEASRLTITAGSVQIQPPRITNEGETVTCTEATLTLSFNDAEAGRQALTIPEADANGAYILQLTDVSFDIPTMEDDQQLTLCLDVTLSNGQTLTDANGTWFYMGGELVSVVG